MISRAAQIGFALAFVLVPTNAWSAGWTSGNDLAKHCQEEGNFISGVCTGYIVGVADVVDGFLSEHELFCIPPGATVGQITSVVSKYMDEHPEYLHYVGSNSVILALGTAFPC